MFLDIGRLVAGGVLLYFGAEWLVRGASGLARSFGVSALVVGLTVVAYGTSAPELVVSGLAAAEGKGAIAVGNVVGSNIANLGLILGVTALIRPPRVPGSLVKREIPILLASALALPLVMLDGVIGRLNALLLVAGAMAFTVVALKAGKADPMAIANAEEETREAAGTGPRPKLVGLVALGLALLVGGGKLLVDGATGLALAAGISERVIGLTIVAVGTSLPELATSLVAAFRGHSDIAVGNVVGSNIFNALFILGMAGLISPVAAPLAAYRLDLAVMGGMTLVGALAMRSARTVQRAEGAVLVVGYAAYIAALVALPT